MNIKLPHLLLSTLLAAALAACSEPSEVYYSTRYEVTSLEAVVTLSDTPTEPENPDSGSGTAAIRPSADDETGDGSGDGSEGGSDGGENESPVIEEIRNAVLAAAPVQAGGSYVLDYSEYNGGLPRGKPPARCSGSNPRAERGAPLRVKPSAEGETLSGTFVKMPGSSEITFTYGEGVEYTATLSSYTTAEGARCARFTVDLTESYRTLYPDAGIESVVRYENTSHAAN